MDEAAAGEPSIMKALHIMEEFRERRRRRGERRAKKLGFSSWEEYKCHQRKQWRLRDESYEKFLDEECVRLGKTREELAAEDPQRDVSDGWNPQCDCEGECPSLRI